MKIQLAAHGTKMQFVVFAESMEERLILSTFLKQCDQEDVCIHGSTYAGGADDPWPSSFNFGTHVAKDNPLEAEV